MRLIDADAVINELEEMANNEWNISVGSSKGLNNAIDVIDNIPTVEYPFYKEAYQTGFEEGKNERPKGEWIFNQYDGNANIGNWHCSECRHIEIGGYNQKPNANFCPNCGADMRGEKK